MRVGCVRTFYSPLLSFANIILISILFQTVSSQDNLPPTFSATQYIFSVPEDATMGSELTATSPLGGVSFVYYILSN